MENYNNKTVCVTGGTGFIALCLVKRLLEKGYIVHTTVRDPGNTQKVQSLIQLPGASSRLKIFKADLLDDGSFDDAIAGCDGVFHVASPVTLSEKDPENEVIKPAVKGTLNVLEACRKAGTVKRVIVTGSASALLFKESHEKDEVVDESSWSDLDFLQTKRPHRWVRFLQFVNVRFISYLWEAGAEAREARFEAVREGFHIEAGQKGYWKRGSASGQVEAPRKCQKHVSEAEAAWKHFSLF